MADAARGSPSPRRLAPARVLFLAALAAPLRAQEADDHLAVGNPSGATADVGKADNYLIKKPTGPDRLDVQPDPLVP